MLLKLLLLRFCPMAMLGFIKDKNQIKKAIYILCSLYGIGFFAALMQIIKSESLYSIICIPLAVFPHYICYVFAMFLFIRCIWHAWSKRVWKRIYLIALISILLGVFMECYWNPKILQIFFNFFK